MKKPLLPIIVSHQGAAALLSATIAFLRKNKIPKDLIVNSVNRHFALRTPNGNIREYRGQMRAYEEMGIILSCWYSLPKFLNKDGCPVKLSGTRGSLSVYSLVRASHVKLSTQTAIELMRISPSVSIDTFGNFEALNRVFVLPDFEVPRAALVIERYLDTLTRNSSVLKKRATPLLERNCYVPGINLTTIAPLLRDIKERGTAFMDSVDGEIEGHRRLRTKHHKAGELGVLIFAWTRPSRRQKPKSIA